MDKKLYEERVEAAQEMLLDSMTSIKIDDPDYVKKATVASGLYQRINEDNKNLNEREIEMAKVAVEEETSKHEWLGTIIHGFLTGAQIAATIFCAVKTEKSINRRFDIASNYEENNAYLTQTQKNTVAEGLKPRHMNKMF